MRPSSAVMALVSAGALGAATAAIQTGPASTIVVSPSWLVNDTAGVLEGTHGGHTEQAHLLAAESTTEIDDVSSADDVETTASSSSSSSSPARIRTAAADPLAFKGSIMSLVIFCALSICLF